MKNKFLVLILISLFFFQVVSAVLISDQGTDVKEVATGNLTALANLTISIYDDSTGGNLIFEQNFSEGIANGSWNVMINPNLEYGKSYWKDYQINSEDLDFDGNERLEFQSPLGLINNFSFINFSLINSCSEGSSIRLIYENGSVECETDDSSSTTNLTDYALKNQSEIFTGNITTSQTGFFGWLGDLTSRITKLFVQDIDFNGTLEGEGDINITGNITASYFIGDGSLLTNLPAGSGDNTSWNESYADTLYSGIAWGYNQSTPVITYADNINASLSSRIDGISGGNSSFNQTLTDTLYSGIAWGYNQSDYDTFGQWWFNQSDLQYNFNQTENLPIRGGDFNSTNFQEAFWLNVTDYNSTIQTYLFNQSDLQYNFNQSNITHEFNFNQSDLEFNFNQSDLQYNFNQSDLDLVYASATNQWLFNQSDLKYNFNQSNLDLVYSKINGSEQYWNVSGTDIFPQSLGYNIGIGVTNPTYKLDVNSTNPGYPVYGIKGYAETNAIYSAYGVYGEGKIVSTNGTSIAYGIYGTASGGNTNYAGYFEGNVYASGDVILSPGSSGGVGIGTASPTDKLTVIANTTGAYINGLNAIAQTDNIYGATGIIGNGINSGASGTAYGIVGKASGAASNYGFYSSLTDTSSSANYGIYASATGGPLNYAGYFASGKVGIVDIAAGDASDYVCIDGSGVLSSGSTCTIFEDIKQPLVIENLKEQEFKIIDIEKEKYSIYHPIKRLRGEVHNYFYDVQFVLNGIEVTGNIKVPGNMNNETEIFYYLKKKIEQERISSTVLEKETSDLIGRKVDFSEASYEINEIEERIEIVQEPEIEPTNETQKLNTTEVIK